MRFILLTLICLISFLMACSSSNSFLALPANKMLLATGNEPGWILQITPDKNILLVTNYGSDSIVLNGNKDKCEYEAYSINKVKGEKMYFPENKLAIDIQHINCQDNMDGNKSAETIKLTINEQVLKGCGSYTNL